jgi:hypothetical protein
MDPRRQGIWELHDFSSGHGLEVGPLHRCIVGRDEGDVSYVDVLDRDGLLEHYRNDPHVPAESIPEIDFHLIQDDGRTLSLVEATKPGAPFDWVVASHVIEHVPDVIGWLAELAEMVVDDGTLVLVVPDKRYCFDVHRPPSTVGQMIAANFAGDRRPNIGAVYDYFSSSVDYDVKELWAGEMPHFDRRIHSLAEAQHHVERTLAGEYVDCHVWLFTPDSFLRQIHELRVTGHSQWSVERLEPTPRHDLEFRVVMRRIPRGQDATAPQLDEQRSESNVPDWLELEARGLRAKGLDKKVARLERRVLRLRAKSDQQAARTRRLRRRLKAAEAPAPPLRVRLSRLARTPARVLGRARARRARD